MRTRRLHPFIGAVATLLMGVGVHLVGQQSNAVTAFTDGDWPRYAGDFAGTKHSRLTQINTSNASRLVQVWTFGGVGTQQTPIAVNGIVYASAPGGVVALDGTTGDVVWRYGAATAAAVESRRYATAVRREVTSPASFAVNRAFRTDGAS